MAIAVTSFDLSAISDLAIARSFPCNFAGRPPTLPRALAAVNPACVRSRIKLRSNSANDPKMLKINRPLAELVSMLSEREANPIPCASSSDTWSKCLNDPDNKNLPSGYKKLECKRYIVILNIMQGVKTMSTAVMRASYSFSTPTLLRFNAVVPQGERSRVLERYMQTAIMSRERELEAIASAFMADPANAEAIADEKLWDITIGDGLEGIPA
jgi:hypothetical protein